jgi:hypothetical protein
MAPNLKRREFVSRATGGAAGVLGFLYPGATALAHARNPHVQADLVTPPPGVTVNAMSGPDPTFAQGKVTSLVSSPRLATSMVLVGPGGSRSVSMVPTDVVWKEILGSPALINTGDWVILKGAPQPDGSLAAQSGMIFVNIARRDGTVVASSASSIMLHSRRTLTVDGSLTPTNEALGLSSSVEVIHQRDGSAYQGGVAAIPANTPVGAVGITLSDGSFRATRVWVVD